MLHTISNLIGTDCIDDLQHEVLDRLSVYVFWKDKHGKYLGCNQAFANLLNYQKNQDLIGITDFDLCWADTASIFQANDRRVMLSEKNVITIEPGKIGNGSDTLAISYKLPLRDVAKKTMGIIGVAIPVNKEDILNLNREMIHHISDEVENKPNINLNLINSYNLSPRQKDCLYYFARGFTIKQIACKFNLSSRTVGHYLDNVKIKLNCSNRSELIDKLLS